jgi:hypothetical protein
VAEETDNSATTVRSRSLTQGQRQAAHLPALLTQEDIPNRTDLYVCVSFPGLLKLQQIVLKG